MRGIGGTNMENRGIDYRERSPLVVPPKLDLPPPAATAAEVKAPNWPKDPDEQRRKAADRGAQEREQGPARSGPHPDAGRTRGGQDRAAPRARTTIRCSPASTNNPILSPSQLGYSGGFSGMFGGNKTETAPFKGEPTREFADPAAARLPDAVAELCLRHRAEGIAQQGIQPGQGQVWRIVKHGE